MQRKLTALGLAVATLAVFVAGFNAGTWSATDKLNAEKIAVLEAERSARIEIEKERNALRAKVLANEDRLDAYRLRLRGISERLRRAEDGRNPPSDANACAERLERCEGLLRSSADVVDGGGRLLRRFAQCTEAVEQR